MAPTWCEENSVSGIAEDICFHLRATLIIVPSHITTQWQQETRKFLGFKTSEVFVISKLVTLSKIKPEAMQSYKIIILSAAIFQEAEYKNQICYLSDRDDVEPTSVLSLSGRELESFYRSVVESSRILVQHYQQKTKAGMKESDAELSANKLLVERQGIARNNLATVSVADPGQGRKKAKKAQSSKKPSKRVGDDPESSPRKRKAPQNTKGPWKASWLHNYSFARIIWDEFSYENERLGFFFETAMANAKWLLSATPKMTELGHICNIARKFNVHIARPEPQMMPGLPAVARGPVLSHTTKSEDFRAFSSPVRSVDLALHRDERAREFLRAYCRANVIEGSAMAVKETIIQADMAPLHAVKYFTTLSETLDSNWDYYLLPSHVRTLIPLGGTTELRAQNPRDLCVSLLIQLAAGLGVQESASAGKLIQRFKDKIEGMEHQFKLLFDHVMWSLRKLHSLQTDQTAKQEGFTSALNHAKSSANAMIGDATPGKYMRHGGAENFFTHRRILTSDAATPSLENFALRHALYTWIDFYDLSVQSLRKMRIDEVAELARELVILMCKHPRYNANSQPTERDVLWAASREKNWSIPENIELLVRENKSIPDDASKKDYLNFIERWLAAKAPKPQCPPDDQLPAPRAKKAEVQEKLLEHNIAFKETYSLKKLRELLWFHENGHHGEFAYRDGRPAINPHQDFPVATDSKLQWEPLADDIKKTSSDLNRLLEDLVATRRELRFIHRILGLPNDDRDQQVKQCDCCKKELGAENKPFLVTSCGHSLCSECRRQIDQKCPVEYCNAFTLERPILPYSAINFSQAAITRAEEVAKFIEREIPNQDHVVVFGQYHNMLNALADEFNKRKISFASLARSSASGTKAKSSDMDVAKLLENYKDLKGGKVLLLDIESDTSAGSNITVANHVIFATPFYNADPGHRERTIRQAVGRCVRRGQTKTVMIYHFMARNSMEEKILRDRIEWEEAQDQAGTLIKSHNRESFKEVFTRCVDKLPYWMDDEVYEDAPVDGKDESTFDADGHLKDDREEPMNIDEETYAVVEHLVVEAL